MNEPRRMPPPPRPVTTMALVWFAAFFFLYGLLLVAPTLLRATATLPPGPEAQEAVRLAVRDAIRPKLPIAFGAALVTTALGLRARLLPGARPPRSDAALSRPRGV